MKSVAVDNFEADPTSNNQFSVSASREFHDPDPEASRWNLEFFQKELHFSGSSNTITVVTVKLDSAVQDSIEFLVAPDAQVYRFRVGFSHAVTTAWQLDPREVAKSITQWFSQTAPHHEVALPQQPMPSALAQSFLQGMKENADKEIQGHLRAGRSVHGLRDGRVVTIKATK